VRGEENLFWPLISSAGIRNSFATLRFQNCLHSPGFRCSRCNVVRCCYDLEACSLVTATIAIVISDCTISSRRIINIYWWLNYMLGKSCFSNSRLKNPTPNSPYQSNGQRSLQRPPLTLARDCNRPLDPMAGLRTVVFSTAHMSAAGVMQTCPESAEDTSQDGLVVSLTSWPCFCLGIH
jgi:hypothetical protein